MFFSDQTTRLWFTFYFPGHPRSPVLCGSSVIYFLRLLAVILLSPHSIFLAFITPLLMLFPAFIGRNSGIWPLRLSPTQFQSLISFGSSLSLLFRGAVPGLSGARVGFVYMQLLPVWPEEILWILLSTRQTSPVGLPLPHRQMDVLPVCKIRDSKLCWMEKTEIGYVACYPKHTMVHVS